MHNTAVVPEVVICDFPQSQLKLNTFISKWHVAYSKSLGKCFNIFAIFKDVVKVSAVQYSGS